MKTRKIRSDSAFAKLTPEQHDELVAWLVVDKIGYSKAQERLRDDFNVNVSISALGDFYRNHCFLNNFQRASKLAETFADELKDNPDRFDEISIAAVKQMVFELTATGVANPDDLVKLFGVITNFSKLQLDRDKLKLESAKFKRTTAELFLEFYADKKAQEIAASADAKEIKTEKLVQLMFGDRPDNLQYA